MISLRLDRDLQEAIEKYAKENDLTRTQAIKKAIKQFIGTPVVANNATPRTVAKKPTVQNGPEFEIFKEYCMSWDKNPNKYQLTPQRKKWIKEAVACYSYEEALNAVKAFRNDNFENRAKFNGIEYLFGKRERIDKWCSKQPTAYDTEFNKAKQRYDKSQARLELAMNLSKERAKNEQKR